MNAIWIYPLAAFAEIAGCFAFWAWFRMDRSAWWLLPGVLALVLFAYLLARIEADAAGRAFAAYGGVYITASLGWLWLVEDTRPDRWDVLGASICLAGAAIILFAPRAACKAAESFWKRKHRPTSQGTRLYCERLGPRKN